MIYVFATARIKAGHLPEALACYQQLVPVVLANEPGCLEYSPTLNFDLGLPNQEGDDRQIHVLERWHSVEDFRAHLGMAHCLEFRKRIAPCLEEGIRVRITQAVA